MGTYTADHLYNCCTHHAKPDWADYKALVVGGCVNDAEGDEDGTCIIGNMPREDAEFFTVYGRDHEGLVMAITDADSLGDAMGVAVHLSGLSGLPIVVEC